MAKRKSRIKSLLISSPKGMDFLQPIIKEIILGIDAEIQLNLYTQLDRNIIIPSGQKDRDFVGEISSTDLIFVDLSRTSPTMFFEIGLARAIGKPIVFISEDIYVEELPDFIKQSYFIIYTKKEELQSRLKSFFLEYIENPKRFAPRRLVGLDTGSRIVVDLEKLEPRDFENLCFELLSRLGYKQLEWQMKDDFVDAMTTLRKQDPDGFEYEELWLVSFSSKGFSNERIFDLLHDQEFFIERLFRNISDIEGMDRNRLLQSKNDTPITFLFILRGKENSAKKLIKDMARREFRSHRRGLSVRIRWWDESSITSLVQNNSTIARKYFSSEALIRSSVRLSYEELSKQYADMNEELEGANKLLISERSKVESLERDAAWKILAFIAAHKLGNPIDAIDSELSNLKVALDKGKLDTVKEIIDNMDLPIEKAKLIVSEFRSLSVAQEIKPDPVSSEKLNDLLKYSAKPAIDKNVSVLFDFKNVADILGDTQKLSDCFSELIRNSLHFILKEHQTGQFAEHTSPNPIPEIKIATDLAKLSDLPEKIEKTKEYVKITFADNGCGVPFEKKLLIFRAFETTYVHGTGLGLAICESIIEKHGGKIIETGKPNDGAVFEIFLPINKK